MDTDCSLGVFHLDISSFGGSKSKDDDDSIDVEMLEIEDNIDLDDMKDALDDELKEEKKPS